MKLHTVLVLRHPSRDASSISFALSLEPFLLWHPARCSFYGRLRPGDTVGVCFRCSEQSRFCAGEGVDRLPTATILIPALFISAKTIR
jgi:hypothetical protein